MMGRRMTGCRFLTGPFGLPGFCKAVRIPLPISICLWCSKQSFNIVLICEWRISGPYLINSAVILLYPDDLFINSSFVIGWFNFLGLPMNGSSFDVFWSMNCFPKCCFICFLWQFKLQFYHDLCYVNHFHMISYIFTIFIMYIGIFEILSFQHIHCFEHFITVLILNSNQPIKTLLIILMSCDSLNRCK